MSGSGLRYFTVVYGRRLSMSQYITCFWYSDDTLPFQSFYAGTGVPYSSWYPISKQRIAFAGVVTADYDTSSKDRLALIRLECL